MLYLVDGYNLMYAARRVTGEVGSSLLDERFRVIGMLERYRKLRPDVEVSVVFDARSGAVPASPLSVDAAVRVIFGRREGGADEEIVRLLEKAFRSEGGHREGGPLPVRGGERTFRARAITVVTSDGGIARNVRALGASVVTSDGFLADLAEREKRKAQPSSPPVAPEKPTGLSEAEVEYWKRAFGA